MAERTFRTDPIKVRYSASTRDGFPDSVCIYFDVPQATDLAAADRGTADSATAFNSLMQAVTEVASEADPNAPRWINSSFELKPDAVKAKAKAIAEEQLDAVNAVLASKGINLSELMAEQVDA